MIEFPSLQKNGMNHGVTHKLVTEKELNRLI